MNTFLRLMHEGLIFSGQDEQKLDLSRELSLGLRVVPQIRERLKTAFSECGHLNGNIKQLAATSDDTEAALARFVRLSLTPLPGIEVVWNETSRKGRLLGMARVAEAQHPFRLRLTSYAGWLCLRCVFPLWRVASVDEAWALLKNFCKRSLVELVP